MRAWVCVAAAAACVVVTGVAGQGNKDPNTRLGLVATQLGVNPVPGGHQNGNPGSARQELVCQCIPINQVCPYDEDGNPVGVVTRISNTTPLVNGQCIDNRIRCCGLQHVPGPFPGGPASGRCGTRANLGFPALQPPQADFAEYPWMAVVLGPGNSYLGGGALIRNNWVLTAAHKLSSKNLKVRLGDYNLAQSVDVPQYPHIELNVKSTVIHPQFDSKSLVNDVALLELERPISLGLQYPHIGLACMPTQGQKFEGQEKCFVSGWGKDTFNNGQFQNILKEVDLPIVESFNCQYRLRETHLGKNFELNTNSFLCAGGVEGKDACTGDGGSPLVCPSGGGRYTVVGLVAWGIGCAQGDVPGVYVNVANFVNFIEGYVGPLH